jgi:uncharacterized protein (DUF2237 family)
MFLHVPSMAFALLLGSGPRPSPSTGTLVRSTGARMCDELLKEPARNAIGTELQCCCADVRGSGIGTGFYRDGFCATGPLDEGRHTVCIEATKEFLAVSAAAGNPLHEPMPQYAFPGVQPGDCWCLCASRYAQLLELEAKEAVRDPQGKPLKGFVPRVYIQATHEKTIEHVPLETLMSYAIDAAEAKKEVERVDALRQALEKGTQL